MLTDTIMDSIVVIYNSWIVRLILWTFAFRLIVYLISKIAILIISWQIRRYLPCHIYVQSFGFFWVKGIRIMFLNSEVVNISHVYLTSSLWNSNARCLLTLVVSGVQFYTSLDGLLSLWTILRMARGWRSSRARHPAASTGTVSSPTKGVSGRKRQRGWLFYLTQMIGVNVQHIVFGLDVLPRSSPSLVAKLGEAKLSCGFDASNFRVQLNFNGASAKIFSPPAPVHPGSDTTEEQRMVCLLANMSCSVAAQLVLSRSKSRLVQAARVKVHAIKIFAVEELIGEMNGAVEALVTKSQQLVAAGSALSGARSTAVLTNPRNAVTSNTDGSGASTADGHSAAPNSKRTRTAGLLDWLPREMTWTADPIEVEILRRPLEKNVQVTWEGMSFSLSQSMVAGDNSHRTNSNTHQDGVTAPVIHSDSCSSLEGQQEHRRDQEERSVAAETFSGRLVLLGFRTATPSLVFASANKVDINFQLDKEAVSLGCRLDNPIFLYLHEEVLFWRRLFRSGGALVTEMVNVSRQTSAPSASVATGGSADRAGLNRSAVVFPRWLVSLLLRRRLGVKLEMNCGYGDKSGAGLDDSQVTIRIMHTEKLPGLELGLKSWTINFESEQALRPQSDSQRGQGATDIAAATLAGAYFYLDIRTAYCKHLWSPVVMAEFSNDLHHWDTAVYIGDCFFWGHKQHLGCKLNNLQLEWSPQLHRVLELLLPKHQNTTVANSSKSTNQQHARNEDSTPIATSPPSQWGLFTSWGMEMKFEHINVFAVSKNDVFLMQRTDSVQLVSQDHVQTTLVIQATQLVYDERHAPFTTAATRSPAGQQGEETDEWNGVRYDAYRLCPTSQIQHQLVRIPEVSVQYGRIDQTISVVCGEDACLLWTPAMHLCLHEAVTAVKSLHKHYRGTRDKKATAETVAPAAPMQTPERRESVDKKQSSSGLRTAIKFTTSLKLYLEVSQNHKVAFILHQLDGTLLAGGRVKWTAPHFILQFDQHEIFIFENVVLRCIPPTNQYRKFERLRLTTEINKTWEFYADACFITFPYKYNFFDCYHDLMSIRKFLRTMHKSESDPLSPQRPLPPDYVIVVKKFVLEIKDDPFECQLGDDFLVLLDETAQHELRMESMKTHIKKRIQEGARYTVSDQHACYDQLEQQRSVHYITRLTRFYQGYKPPEELFTWILENVQIRSHADGDFHGRDNVIRQIRDIDKASPFPQDILKFSTLWCRMVNFSADSWRWKLRDYGKPLWEMNDMLLWGRLASAEREPEWQAKREVTIVPGEPWPTFEVVRNMCPVKFYHDFSADMKEMIICYGPNWEPCFSWLNLSMELINRPSRDPSPPMAWWDKSRLKLHGRLCFAAEQMQWLYPTSLDPYNTTEFFDWQWTHVMVNWENMRWLLEGNLDIFCRSASKYDGDCRLLHLPNLELLILLDWICAGDPNNHHVVMPCAPHKLPHMPPGEVYDTYKYFRSINLIMNISFTVKQPMENDMSRCTFYTNFLKFFDKFKMCMTKVSRPIRRGPLFKCIKKRKPVLGRLFKSINLKVSLPQLDLTYWVSFAKRTGVHLQTGQVTIAGDFRLEVIPQPRGGLTRRPRTNWSVAGMTATLQEGRTWLRDRPPAEDEPGEMDGGSPVGRAASGSISVGNLPEFMIIPRIVYERLSPPTTQPATPLSDDELTPMHRVEVVDLKVRWTEENRNLVYTMMDSYQHAQSLKKNLSAQALRGIQLQRPTSTVAHSPSLRARPSGAHDRVPVAVTPPDDDSGPPSSLSGDQSQPSSMVTGQTSSGSGTAQPGGRVGQEIPMLSQLIEEADTAKLYAYCEQDPKQADVVDRLQGVALCTSTQVISRKWHVEIINSQVMLKTAELKGYVIVSAARTKLDSLDHWPLWRDSQLLTKSALVGKLECMQYYATVGQVDPKAPDQWLNTGDVEDHEEQEDVLSGRPEVVGCGKAVGGVVSACVGWAGTEQKGPASIQLQRMISRCTCHVYYISYDQADPASLPDHLIPPLPLDENEVVRTSEGANTFTLLHRNLNVCTNSLQYHMIVDLVNDLLLYVEPQRKARVERNRVELSLLNEEQLKLAILRDQEALRHLVENQRRAEKELWSLANQMGPAGFRTTTPTTDKVKQHFENQILRLKTQIVEKNTALSQSITYYQQVRVQSQRRNIIGAQATPRVISSANLPLPPPPSMPASLTSAEAGEDQLSIVPSSGTNATIPSVASTATFASSTLVPTATSGIGGSNVASGSLTTGGAQAAGNGEHQQHLQGSESEPALASRPRDIPITAEIVRRNEVCFELARWRMTETDGQIGLADVELRGFIYSKTNREDDSGDHRIELGWVKVANLIPTSFYKEVLLPDASAPQYTGGPVLRISCIERFPVGGIPVKEAMEISVAPLILQVSKLFYRTMMPYFFPEKSDEGTAATTSETLAVVAVTGTDQLSAAGTKESSRNAQRSVGLGDVVATSSGQQQQVRLMKFTRRSSLPPTIGDAESSGDPKAAADGWDTTDLHATTADLVSEAGEKHKKHNILHRVSARVVAQLSVRKHDRRQDQNNSSNLDLPSQSDRPPISDEEKEREANENTNLTVDQALAGAFITGEGTLGVGVMGTGTAYDNSSAPRIMVSPPGPTSSTGSTLASGRQMVTAAGSNSTGGAGGGTKATSVASNIAAAAGGPGNTGTTAVARGDPVELMRERANKNNVFLYIKIPEFPIRLSYKGEKQNNLTDVTNFALTIPTIEYHNRLFTWLDFAMEVKTRIRRQLLKEIIRKKFTTPLSRFPFIQTTASRPQTNGARPDASTSAQEEEDREKRTIEMLLGRHAHQKESRKAKLGLFKRKK